MVSDEDFEITGSKVVYQYEHRSPYRFAWRAAEALIRRKMGIKETSTRTHDGDPDRDIEIKSAVAEQQNGNPGTIVIHREQHLNNIAENRNYLLCVVSVEAADTWTVLDVSEMSAKDLDRVLDIPDKWQWNEDENDWIVVEKWRDIPYLHRPDFYQTVYEAFSVDIEEQPPAESEHKTI